MTTIAVIQPYFYPYAGYFRLFAAADVVVMFDCVQFPRRGWVHRNRFALANGELDWLTLPLAKAPQETRIDELRFRTDAATVLTSAMQRFPALAEAHRRRHPVLERLLAFETNDVTAYLCALVADVTARLEIERPMIRSSTLAIDAELRGQQRVIEIVRKLGGKRYINPSGGRDLYDHTAFQQAGLELRFLSPFEGCMESVLSRLVSETASTISAEIRTQTVLAA